MQIIKPATQEDFYDSGENAFIFYKFEKQKSSLSRLSGVLAKFAALVICIILITGLHIYSRNRDHSLRKNDRVCGKLIVPCLSNNSAHLMFQYAGLLGLAKMNRKEPVFQCPQGYEWLKREFRLGSKFELSQTISNDQMSLLKQNSFNETLLNLPCGQDVLVDDQLNFYLYFNHVKADLSSNFKPAKPSRACHIILLNEFEHCKVLVGLYLNFKSTGDEQERQNENSFIQKAVGYLRNFYSPDCLKFVTLDKGVASLLNTSNVVELVVNNAAEHLCILNNVHAMVIGGHNLTWWTAFLSNAKIIYPHFAFANNTNLWQEYYFPTDWIKI